MQLKDAIDTKFMDLFKEENLPVLKKETMDGPDNEETSDDGDRKYDTSQYDAVYGERPEPMIPSDAALYLQRTDDDVDYEVAWNILRDMADDKDNYRQQVLDGIKAELGRKHLPGVAEDEIIITRWNLTDEEQQ